MNISDIDKIENFYTKIYNEDERLEKSLDRRHFTEKAVKEEIIKRYATPGEYVCEIGAGKGYWVGRLLEMGCYVKAYDIVKEHVDVINERYTSHPRFLGAKQWNIVEVPPETKDVFDLVLVSGPIYHTKNIKDKERIIDNSKKMLSCGGYMLIDFLPPVNAALETLLNRTTPNAVSLTTLKPDEKNIFSYDTVADMNYLCRNSSMQVVRAIPLDGISRLLGKRLEEMSEESFEEYLGFMKRTAAGSSFTESLADLSEHSVIVSKQSPIRYETTV